MTYSKSPQLPRGAIGFGLGIAGMLVSLYYSIMFIAGNATGIDLLIGVIFALTLDYGKVALATEALYALAGFRLISAVVYSLIVLSLYALSMLAATFMLTSHNANAVGEQYDTRIATIQQSITAKRAEVAACPAGFVTKCLNPRTKELTALQSELSVAQNVSKDVIAAKNTALTWDKLAKTLGTTPDELQVKLAFARAVLLEIIAPIFVSIFLSAYRNRLPSSQHEPTARVVSDAPSQMPQVQQQPAQVPQTAQSAQLPSYSVKL